MNSRYTSTWISGSGLVAVSLLLFGFATLAQDEESYLNPVCVAVLLALCCGALCWHLQGYIKLGKQNTLKYLVGSGRVMVWFLSLFYLSIILDELLLPVGNELVLIQAFIGLTLILVAIPTLLFMIGVIAGHEKLGLPFTVIAVSIIPATVFFVWDPWPTALLAIVSSYLFYRLDKTS